MPGAQAVAGEEDLGIALTLADVVVGALQQLDGGPGAQVAAADADDHEHVAVGADPIRDGLDAEHFLGGLLSGQLQPAQEVIARAVALHQGIVGRCNILLQSQKIRKSDLAPHIGDINFNHVGITHPFVYCGICAISICYRKSAPNASPRKKVSADFTFFHESYGNFRQSHV